MVPRNRNLKSKTSIRFDFDEILARNGYLKMKWKRQTFKTAE